MKKIKMFLISLVLISNFMSSAEACRLHAKMISKSSSLPGNSIYHIDSTWVNQNNNKVLFRSLSGHPRIVAMVYTKCPTSCPMLVQDVKTIVSQLPENLRKNLQIDLFSFDSNSESAQTLQGFRAKYKMDDNWSAYAGSPNAVSELAAVLGLQYKKLPSGDFIHSNVFFLLNSKGEIVAKQEGVKSDSSLFLQKVEQSLRTGGSI
jgi:protein SCO1/2